MHMSRSLIWLLLALAVSAWTAAPPSVGTPVVFGASAQGWVKFKTVIPEKMSFVGSRFLPPDGAVRKSAYPTVPWLDADSLAWTPDTATKGDSFYCTLAFTNDLAAAGWPVLAMAPAVGPNAVRTLAFSTSALAPAEGTVTVQLLLSTTEHTSAEGKLDPNTAGDALVSIAVNGVETAINKPCMALTGYGCGATNEGTTKFSLLPVTLPLQPSARYAITLKSAPYAQNFAKHMINGLFVPTQLGAAAQASTPKYEKTDYVYGNGRAAMTAQDLQDAQATNGKSLRMAAEKGASGCVADAYSYPPYPGRYRFTYRLKIDNNAGGAEVVRLSPVFPGVQNPWLPITAKDFAAANAYQEFSVDGVVPENTFGAYYANYNAQAGRNIWWESVKYTLQEPYSDQRCVDEWYPNDRLTAHVTRTADAEKLRAHVTYGPAFESSGLREALKALGKTAPAVDPLPADMRFYKVPGPRKAGEWRETAYIDHGQVKDRTRGFPATPADFAGLDLIVLANVPGRGVNAPARIMLDDWVRHGGGGLLLTGGLLALGKGYLDGTVLEALLPVELCGVNDTRPAKDGALLVKDPALAAVLGDAKLATRFYQEVKVKPGATVLIATADGAPLLVEWPAGAGRVAVWAGLPLGSVPEGQTAWWKSDRWSAVMANVLTRIAGK
jgi:uncharacterized membrane protein